MAAFDHRVHGAATPDWGDAAQAMFRAAQAVSHPGGPTLFADLVRELADILQSATVFIAVFTDESRSQLHTLAAMLDGEPLHDFDYPLEGSPCAAVVGRAFRYMAHGVAAEFPPGTIFGAKGMDSYAAFPLNDSRGTPMGLLVAMDRQPIADATLAEALLKIFAGRIVAEIERGRADEALRAAALAVSSAHGETVFAELVRYLATILHVELAFIARHEPGEALDMRMMSMYCDGKWMPDSRYPLEASPCAHVLGRQFRAYPARLRELFPQDRDAEALGLESYAGFPLTDRHGQPLGTVGVASRKPLNHLERIESMLQIFAVRAAAELEQLRAREALSRSEASYRAIFESAEDAIFIHDWHTGEVLDVNPKACETHGYSREEMRGISLADVSSGVPPYTAEHALAKIQLARLGRCPPFEWHRRNKDGSLHWDEVRLKPAIIDGRAHVLAFARDITERAQLEAQLRQAQKMEAIGQLTGGIAHDFNNILTSVLGYLELGQQRAQTLADAALVRQLGAAELAAQRARDLIAQMLTFARRQRGERRVLALAPLVRQSLQLLRSTLPASVVVDAATLDGFTREDGDLSVMADAVQIEQVLFNLCINARDAIEGTGSIRVRLGAADGGWTCASCRAHVEAGRWVALCVADSGSGIAAEVVERMFEPFFSTKEVGRGSGMGLAMVHGIVHDHGGHIDVQTSPGAGSLFRVVLPLADAGERAAPEATPTPEREPRLNGRVLVVEDEPMVGDFMAELLGGWGLQVTLMRDPVAARAWLADPANALDLLITDQTMPHLTGLDLATAAKASRPGLPIVLYSGNTQVPDASAMPPRSVDAMLQKPVDAGALRLLIQRWLQPSAITAPRDAG